jgi:protein SCO1/2
MPEPPGSPSRGLSVAGAIASVGYAFFPKCPFCWAAYLSVFGIAGLEQIPYSPWLKQLFVVLMLLNVFCVWIRARTTRRVTPFVLVSAGAVAILVSRTSSTLEHPAAWLGVGLSLAGSFLSAAQTPRRRVRAID